MPLDDDADDDVGGFGPPLPPDDRLWRHPSELAGLSRPGALATTPLPVGDARASAWPIAAVAGLVGAALSTAVMAVTGVLSADVVERSVIEKIAVAPVVSSPMLRGEQEVTEVADQTAPAVVRLALSGPDGVTAGSGVIFRTDGMVLTSAHLLDGATAIDVALADGRRFEGHLVGLDRPTDVAVVRIDADDLPVAVLGSSARLEIGATTIAIGCARADGQPPSVSTGVISAVQRRVDDAGESLHGMIQTDAPIDVGVAGGPLVDAGGSVIGIIAPMGAVGDGFHFATPIDLARRVAGQLVASGQAVHGWLGIDGADLTADQARRMDLAGGASVRGVHDDSPAAVGGLSADDVIVEIDGEPVGSASGLVVAMRDRQPGDEVTIGFWRDGERHETTVTVGQHP